jgi:hypothetical protein
MKTYWLRVSFWRLEGPRGMAAQHIAIFIGMKNIHLDNQSRF